LDIVTVTLMLSAGLLHATWHSLVKGGTSQITILAGMGVVAGGAAAAAIPFVPVPTAAVWPILLMSVTVHIGYKLCLARAYELGDLGRAFPLARGMVPLFAAALEQLLAEWLVLAQRGRIRTPVRGRCGVQRMGQ